MGRVYRTHDHQLTPQVCHGPILMAIDVALDSPTHSPTSSPQVSAVDPDALPGGPSISPRSAAADVVTCIHSHVSPT